MKTHRSSLLPTLTLAVCAAGLAQAATTGFVTPDYRNLPGSTHGGWEVMTVPGNTPPGNRPDLPGNLSGASLLQLDPRAVITGTGNIYNHAGVSSFDISHNPGQPVGWVTLQVRTSGTELDYASVRLTYELGGQTLTVAPLDRIELDRSAGMGVNVSSRWDWNLNAIAPTAYRIQFGAKEPLMSFDSAVLDTAAVGVVVPEPATWALVGLGGVMGLVLHRRRTAL